MSVRGGGPHGGEGPRYTQRPEISTYSRDVQCLSSPPPTSFSSSLSSFLPWSVPLVSLALPRGPIQPLLLCSYYQAHGSRPDLRALPDRSPLPNTHSVPSPTPATTLPRGGRRFCENPFFFFFLIDRFPPGYRPRARFLLSFFRFQRNSSLLAVGRSPGSIDLLEITLPFHSLFRGFSTKPSDLSFLTLLYDSTDAGAVVRFVEARTKYGTFCNRILNFLFENYKCYCFIRGENFFDRSNSFSMVQKSFS